MSESAAQKNQQVVACVPPFSKDEVPGFEKTTLELPEEDDGPLTATLIRTQGPEEDPRPAVLYIHGFVDYFFQAHLAKAFESAGFRFYALDLRRHGRSLRPGNRTCMAWNIEDFFVEMDWAIEMVQARHPKIAGLVAHSTGGLITSLYLSSRSAEDIAQSLVLSSPFFGFFLPPLARAKTRLASGVARFVPSLPVPEQMGSVYGKTIHRKFNGEWDYDTEKKPIEGVPLFVGWFRMIRKAHARLRKDVKLPLPILTLHSDKSKRPGSEPTEADQVSDTVLDVEDMKAMSPRLGPQVTLSEIENGVHDLTLSRRPARDIAIERMVKFVQNKSL